MNETSTQEREARSTRNERIDLRTPWLAGALAWLIPGAGHLYQRRYFKGAIIGVSIWSVLLFGLFSGSYREELSDGGTRLHFARNVYCSWRDGDKRLYFIPQACVGAIAVPAWLQSRRPVDATDSVLTTAFAPPRVSSESSTRPNQPTFDEIVGRLHSWLDVSTIYTVVAGLLNVLAIFDAIGGAAPQPIDEENRKTEKTSESPKKRKESEFDVNKD